jgi:hypothetical protein
MSLESYITTDGQSASLSWNKAPPPGSYDQIFITVRQLRVSRCGALSLTRGRVCRLQILLALARAVIVGSESRGIPGHILLSQIRDFPFRRATVGVFDPASTWEPTLGKNVITATNIHATIQDWWKRRFLCDPCRIK